MTEEMPSPDSFTRLLLDWSDGDEGARNEMLPLVYDELRRLAALYLLRERRDHTLQPTALVHEAYLRLIDQRQVNWKNRAQFVGLAAVMMRRILVNHARDRAARLGVVEPRRDADHGQWRGQTLDLGRGSAPP